MAPQDLHSEAFGLEDLLNLTPNDGSYGSAFASNLDWASFGNSLMGFDSTQLTIPEWNEFGADTWSKKDGPNQALTDEETTPSLIARASTSPVNQDSGSSKRQLEIYQEIEEIEENIRENEFANDNSSRNNIELKLRKTQLRLELMQLKNSTAVFRDRKLVSLEFEQVSLRLELLNATRSSEELEEDVQYFELKIQQLHLKKELNELKTNAPSVNSQNPTAQAVSSYILVWTTRSRLS